jgi:hypothetical protein
MASAADVLLQAGAAMAATVPAAVGPDDLTAREAAAEGSDLSLPPRRHVSSMTSSTAHQTPPNFYLLAALTNDLASVWQQLLLKSSFFFSRPTKATSPISWQVQRVSVRRGGAYQWHEVFFDFFGFLWPKTCS